MSNPNKDTVKDFYDERIDGKLADFTNFNPRIESAVESLAMWAPAKPKRILEIGCGIGATTWRMARAWPEAEVIGADISPKSIEVAKACFQLPNLSYRQGLVEPGSISGTFDLIILMDVYEHISQEDRPTLHLALRSLMGPNSRVFFSVPTPACQQFARDNDPSGLQPVDEDIGPGEAVKAAKDCDSALLFYREVGIWRLGDYAYFVIGRFKELDEVRIESKRPTTLKSLFHSIAWRFTKKWFVVDPPRPGDVFVKNNQLVMNRFKVPQRLRIAHAAKWKN